MQFCVNPPDDTWCLKMKRWMILHLKFHCWYRKIEKFRTFYFQNVNFQLCVLEMFICCTWPSPMCSKENRHWRETFLIQVLNKTADKPTIIIMFWRPVTRHVTVLQERLMVGGKTFLRVYSYTVKLIGMEVFLSSFCVMKSWCLCRLHHNIDSNWK